MQLLKTLNHQSQSFPRQAVILVRWSGEVPSAARRRMLCLLEYRVLWSWSGDVNDGVEAESQYNRPCKAKLVSASAREGLENSGRICWRGWPKWTCKNKCGDFRIPFRVIRIPQKLNPNPLCDKESGDPFSGAGTHPIWHGCCCDQFQVNPTKELASDCGRTHSQIGVDILGKVILLKRQQHKRPSTIGPAQFRLGNRHWPKHENATQRAVVRSDRPLSRSYVIWVKTMDFAALRTPFPYSFHMKFHVAVAEGQIWCRSAPIKTFFTISCPTTAAMPQAESGLTAGRTRSKNYGSTTWNPLEGLSLGKVDQALEELDETPRPTCTAPPLQRVQRQRASSHFPTHPRLVSYRSILPLDMKRMLSCNTVSKMWPPSWCHMRAPLIHGKLIIQ